VVIGLEVICPYTELWLQAINILGLMLYLSVSVCEFFYSFVLRSGNILVTRNIELYPDLQDSATPGGRSI
jgi:hypothetical protein